MFFFGGRDRQGQRDKSMIETQTDRQKGCVCGGGGVYSFAFDQKKSIIPSQID